MQAVASGKMLVDVYSSSDMYSGLPGLPTLLSICNSGSKLCVAASVSKVEAMLVQAAKSKVKRTQKEIIQAQFQDLAGSDSMDESMIQANLLSHSRSLLDWVMWWVWSHACADLLKQEPFLERQLSLQRSMLISI